MNDEISEKELEKVNAEIEKEILEMLEVQERGGEYSFDEEESEEGSDQKGFTIFLLIMVVILVVGVILIYSTLFQRIMNLFQ